MTRSRQIAYGKIEGSRSVGDLMTKAVEAEVMGRHLSSLCYETRRGRPKSAPSRAEGMPQTPEDGPKDKDARSGSEACARLQLDIFAEGAADFPEPRSSMRMHPPKAEGERMIYHNVVAQIAI